jgi:hypothetical protein
VDDALRKKMFTFSRNDCSRSPEYAPGAGTVLGAVVDFGVGLVIGVSFDAAMLSIEESQTREDFKLEILRSLSEAKAEHKQSLGL